MISSLDLAPLTQAEEGRRAQLVRESVMAFRRDGCLLLENVVDAAFISDLHQTFIRRYGSAERPRGALRVGHQRYMVTVRLQAPFTDARLYANPALSEIFAELLGPDWVLFSFGAVVSHPGAEDQHVHSDGQSLFGDQAIDADLPPYAMTTIVPLIDMDDATGTTRVWPGSHRMAKDEIGAVTPQDPLVRRGSALLMDYRLHHGGLANRSTVQRPILSLVLVRPWFTDAINFTEQAPLSYSIDDRDLMPPELATRLAGNGPTSTGHGIGRWRDLGARLHARIARS